MKDSTDESGSGSRSPAASSISTSMLVRVQANDAEAWRRLVRLCGPAVYGWCRRAGLKAEDAADAAQEVFLAVTKGIARFRRERPEDSFRGWLYGITQHKVADARRRLAIEPLALGGTNNQDWLAQVPSFVASESSSDRGPSPTVKRLREALEFFRGEFEDRTWRAFWRVSVEGRPPSAVAQELAMSTGAVYIAKSRVLRRIRDELTDLLD